MSAVTKDIVFSYLAGQATVLQKKQMDEWLLEKENEELFCQWLEEWESLHPQYIPGFDKAFEKFSEYIHSTKSLYDKEIPPVAGVKRGSFFLATRTAVAAVIAGLALLAFAFREPLMYKYYRTGNAELKVIDLPDHSRVTLNANSALRISRFFSLLHSRQANLSGEAVFDISHTADSRPFTVAIPGNLEIQVLGTEFNVYARGACHKIFLHRGSIRLRSTDSSVASFLMRPGDMLNSDTAKKMNILRNQSYAQVSAWKDHVFVFNSTSLGQVAQMLEEQFGNKVSIADTALGNRVISGSCKWTKEEDILTTLSLMMKFNVYQSGDTILLK